MTIPQLRVRSGYSFRKGFRDGGGVYGRHPEIIERLKALECSFAAEVDTGTWGHATFEKATVAAEIQPGFGMEFPVTMPDSGFTPVAWVLAKDTKAFYRLTSRIVRDGATPELLAAAEGVIRFCGGALGMPLDAYDYIDINPSSYLHAYEGVQLSRQTGKPMVLTSYNDMPAPEHASFAYSWEVRESVGMRWIASEDEMWSVLRRVMTREEFDAALFNTRAVASVLAGLRLAKAPLIHLDGDLEQKAREGQRMRLEKGHIAEWTDEYEARLKHELEQIQLKKFDSYFLMVSDLMLYAKANMLCGPGRGSSAGSLVCYLLQITEVDPIPFDLLFSRFLDISRADYPDIDMDFSDTKRYMVFDYLKEKYGPENVCKIGNVSTLKSDSTLAQVGKKFGIPVSDTYAVKNAIIEYTSADERYGEGLADTMKNTGPGQDFTAKWPEAARCMGDIEIHPSHSSVHAAGLIVCNDEVWNYCTVNADGVAQMNKYDAEYVGLIKIDALGLRTLGIIEDAEVVTNDYLYGLKYDDQAVLDILNEDKVSGIFQFEGDAVRSVTKMVHVDHFDKIDHLTALARPGPLSSGMATHYVARAAGREEISYELPQLERYLKDTYGVLLYQEQIMSMVRELGDFSWEKASAIRKAMSASKGAAFFDKMKGDFLVGAANHGINEKDAATLWGEMVLFGTWCFNKSHSVSYAIVTYWTCYLKRYFPIEFAAACLRSAKDDTQSIAILRELRDEGVEFTPLDPDLSDVNWKAVDGKLIGGIQNAKGYGPVKALRYVQRREAGTLTEKEREHLMAAEVSIGDLNEAHTLWGHYYDDPVLAGVSSGRKITNMADAKDGETVIVIAKLMLKVLSDMNEQVRIKKRGGKVLRGQTQFLDMMCVDDSTDGAMRFRIDRHMYLEKGKDIAEKALKGSWWLIKGKKVTNIAMFSILAIKQLHVEPQA